jgi:hypothetical protein
MRCFFCLRARDFGDLNTRGIPTCPERLADTEIVFPGEIVPLYGSFYWTQFKKQPPFGLRMNTTRHSWKAESCCRHGLLLHSGSRELPLLASAFTSLYNRRHIKVSVEQTRPCLQHTCAVESIGLSKRSSLHVPMLSQRVND